MDLLVINDAKLIITFIKLTCKVLLRNLEFDIGLYLVKHTEGLYLERYGSKTIYWSRAFTTKLPVEDNQTGVK